MNQGILRMLCLLAVLLVQVPVLKAKSGVQCHATGVSFRSPADEFEHHFEETARSNRVRRFAPREFLIELGIFYDEALVNYYRRAFPECDPENCVKSFVRRVVNSGNKVFQDPSAGEIRLQMFVKSVKLVTHKDIDRKDTAEVHKYLDDFCDWQSNQYAACPSDQWDHAVLFTGKKIFEYTSDNKVISRTHKGGMCHPEYSCSIVTGRDCKFDIVEMLMYSMDSVPYRSNPKSLCREGQFLYNNTHTWSVCAKSLLQEFVETKGKCLLQDCNCRIQTPTGIEKEDLGTVEFDANRQCQLVFGKGWKAFHKLPEHDMCSNLWCEKGTEKKSTEAPALDGTACDRNKICRRRKCQHRSDDTESH